MTNLWLAPDPKEVDRIDNGESDARPNTPNELFVISTRRGDGFQASIRGHLLDLADPGAGHQLAPTPDDLFVLSIASDLAWSAREYLRARGLVDEVGVSVEWRAHEDPPRVRGIKATVTVSKSAETTSAALAAGLNDSIASGSLQEPLHFRVWRRVALFRREEKKREP